MISTRIAPSNLKAYYETPSVFFFALLTFERGTVLWNLRGTFVAILLDSLVGIEPITSVLIQKIHVVLVLKKIKRIAVVWITLLSIAYILVCCEYRDVCKSV